MADELRRYLNGEPILATAKSPIGFPAQLPNDQNPKIEQLGQRKAEAARHIFEYLDWAITQVEATASANDFPIVALYRFLTGQDCNTNTCKSRFCALFLFDAKHTVEALCESERLMRLAQVVKDRCKKGLPPLIEEAEARTNSPNG